jgi:Bacterial regulatory proteins, crp family
MSRFGNGWFKVYRSAIFGDIGSNPVCLAIFIRLLSWAALKPTTVRFNGEPRTISRGTVVIGIRALAEAVGCARETAHRNLKYLEKRDTIRREVGTEGTLITIVNFDRYQGSNETVGHRQDGDEAGSEREARQEPDPNEEVKKRRKKNNAPTESTQLWNYYAAKLKAKEITAIHEGAKTNTFCDKLVKVHGIELAQRMIDAFLSDDAPFVRDKSWPLGLLISQQQQYLNSTKPRGPKKPLVFDDEDF